MASTYQPPRRADGRLRPGPGRAEHASGREIQRARLIGAAIDVVEHEGYANLTVARVVERARVSRKTFYGIFSDREACFLAAFEAAVAAARQLAADAYAAQASWPAKVRAGLDALLAAMDERPGLARVCVVETLGAGDRVLEARTRMLERFAHVIDQGRTVATLAHEPPPQTAEALVGGLAGVLLARLREGSSEPLTALSSEMVSMIVLPFLGAAAARHELARPCPAPRRRRKPTLWCAHEPIAGQRMRLTYRTIRVLMAAAAHPGASNLELAERGGISDQGQISRLMGRLESLGLVENRGRGWRHGTVNEWFLTPLGARLERSVRPR